MFKQNLFSFNKKFKQNIFQQAEKLNFEDSFQKSKAVFQYKCNGCKKTWWGTVSNNTCSSCKSIVDKLPFEKMLGRRSKIMNRFFS